MHHRTRLSVLALALGLGAGIACATYRSDLERSRTAYEQNAHERALAILRALAPDVDRLSPAEQTQYAYLRGMTDFRVGYKGEARHWLAVAQASESEKPGSLPPDWSKRLTETLGELNETVYSSGVSSLVNAKTVLNDDDDKPARRRKIKEEEAVPAASPSAAASARPTPAPSPSASSSAAKP